MHKGKETGVWKTKIHFFGSIYVRFLQLNLYTLTGTLAIVHTFLRQHVSMREFIFYFLKDRCLDARYFLTLTGPARKGKGKNRPPHNTHTHLAWSAGLLDDKSINLALRRSGANLSPSLPCTPLALTSSFWEELRSLPKGQENKQQLL